MTIFGSIYPLIINPPNEKTTLGGKLFVTINLDGGTITPLTTKKDVWSNPPEY